MAVVEEFCLAVKDKWPNCLIQFEDFQTDRAFAILDHMREKVLCFSAPPPFLAFHFLLVHPQNWFETLSTMSTLSS